MPNPFLTSAAHKGEWHHRERSQKDSRENPFLTGSYNNSHHGHHSNSNNSHANHSHANLSDPMPTQPQEKQQTNDFDTLFPSLTQTQTQTQTHTQTQPQIKLNFKSALQPHPATKANDSANSANMDAKATATKGMQLQNQFIRPMNQFLGAGFGRARSHRIHENDENDDADDAYDSAYTKYYDD